MRIARSIIMTVVVLLLLALAVGMLAGFTGGFRNWDSKTWFGNVVDDTDNGNYYNITNWEYHDGVLYASFNAEEEGVEFPKKDMTVKVNGEEKKLMYSKVNMSDGNEDPEYMDFYCSVIKITASNVDLFMEAFLLNESVGFDEIVICVSDEVGEMTDGDEESNANVMVFCKNPALKVSFAKTQKKTE